MNKYLQGDVKKAKFHYKTATKIDPEDKIIQRNLLKLERLLHQRGMAVDWWCCIGDLKSEQYNQNVDKTLEHPRRWCKIAIMFTMVQQGEVRLVMGYRLKIYNRVSVGICLFTDVINQSNDQSQSSSMYNTPIYICHVGIYKFIYWI